MAQVMEAVGLLARQAASSEATIQVPLAGTAGHCDSGNDYNGSLGLRISAIFVILIGSVFGMLVANTLPTCLILIFPGACFPIWTKRRSSGKLFDTLFFGAKFFGSGVIIATAFIHVSTSLALRRRIH
jgi:zinc transporter 1/2/3